MLGRERRTDGLQVVAGIETFRNGADVLAQRLAVAEEGRTREHVHLAAGIVDVVFARDVEAREDEQVCEGITKDGAAAMADMHRASRVRRNVFDVELAALAGRASAVGRSAHSKLCGSATARRRS